MSSLIKKALFVAPAALSMALAPSVNVMAQSLESNLSTHKLIQQVESYRTESTHELGQATGAALFRDVSPRDWAYQALDELTRRYGCLKGYPNDTFRGNRTLTRYEFAAGLNACLQQVERFTGEPIFFTDDADTIRRLTSAFEAELLALDGLESRVSFLEDNQFSTTTQLNGQVLWNLGVPFGGDNLFNGEDELTFDYQARLAFDTSFTGKDRLRTRLDTGNGDSNGLFGAGIASGNGRLNSFSTDGNSVNVDKVWYRTPITDNIQAHIVARGSLIDDVFDMSAAGHAYGAVPIGIAYNTHYYDSPGTGGAALALNLGLNENVGLDIGYFASESNNASQGLFSGDFAVPVQLNFDLGDKLDIMLGYKYGYNSGSNLGTASTTAADGYSGPEVSNHYGVGLAYDVSDNIQFSAFGSKVEVISVSGPTNGFDADIWQWAGTLAFVDLAKEGDVLALSFGQLPTALKREGLTADRDNTYMANIEYRFNVNEHIQLTPAFFAVFNPDGQSTNDTIYAGVLRTIFNF